jgi:hypothetical protein
MANKTVKRSSAARIAAKRKAAARRSQVRLCACGCQKPTARTFAQGHDAKAHSALMKVQRRELKFEDLPSALRAPELAKGDGLIARLLRKLEA